MKSKQRGFTLIEVMVTAAIIAILAAVAYPSYTRHIGRDTTGNLLSKAALLDATRSYMKGLIIIDPTAIGTDRTRRRQSMLEAVDTWQKQSEKSSGLLCERDRLYDQA